MAVKASPPGAVTAPLDAWARMKAEIVFLRFCALGAQLAVEAVKVCAVLELGTAHAPARYGAGLVMVHEGEVIPLVDFRSGSGHGGQLAGAPLLVVLVHGRRFGIAVDRVLGRIGIVFAEIRPPGDGAAGCAPYLTGSVWREGCELFLIDSDRLLGPAVRTHLLQAG